MRKLIADLIALRATFRATGAFTQADALRDTLARHGITVKDTPAGVVTSGTLLPDDSFPIHTFARELFLRVYSVIRRTDYPDHSGQMLNDFEAIVRDEYARAARPETANA